MLACAPAFAQSPIVRADADVLHDEVAVVDVRTIDPHAYKAAAARLPEGAAPRIDGRLDDEVWQLAPAFGDFIQREPRVGARSTERTEFRVLYDDRRLYVAIWAYEPDAGGIVASEMLRDSALRKGDAVRIVLDTFHDHRNAFYFSTNPLGAQKDGYSTENGIMNWEWNAVWEVKVTRDAEGWYSEFAIPLSQIRFRETEGPQEWGFNVGRIIIHKREETHFTPFPREWQGPGIYRISGAGLLTGLSGLVPRRRLEFIPFGAPQVSRDFDAGTPTRRKAGYGFDLRASVTSTLNADVTYRTDFAQVEADQDVVNLTRFGLFFPEKRQFFTQGSSIFGFGRLNDEGGTGARTNAAGPLSLYYSRSIGLSTDGREVPIIGGGRVSGNVGNYAVGLMNIETDDADYAIGTRAVHIPKANYTVARLRRNILRSSSIGAIVLNRQGAVGASSYNRTIGLDGIFSLFRDSVKIVSLFGKTFTPGSTGRDMAGVLNADWTRDRYNATIGYSDIQERFNAEMGFIPRTDIRKGNAGAGWTPRPRWRGVRQLSVSANTEYFEDHRGTPLSRTHDASFSLTRNDRSSFRVGVASDFDNPTTAFRIGPTTIAPGGYDWLTLSLSGNSDDSRRVYGSAGVDVGGYYGGDKTTLRASINLLPLETLLVENSYTRNMIELPGAAPYRTNVLSTRVSYSLSPTLFLKAFVQYNDDRRLANVNLLLWSIYRPGSDLYVVYNEGFDTAVPGPQALRTRNRVFSVKMSWWLSR
ncbi:MAG: DUF5916 domain-containing protein [Vicinamibacterales bacterium]